MYSARFASGHFAQELPAVTNLQWHRQTSTPGKFAMSLSDNFFSGYILIRIQQTVEIINANGAHKNSRKENNRVYKVYF